MKISHFMDKAFFPTHNSSLWGIFYLFNCWQYFDPIFHGKKDKNWQILSRCDWKKDRKLCNGCYRSIAYVLAWSKTKVHINLHLIMRIIHGITTFAFFGREAYWVMSDRNNRIVSSRLAWLTQWVQQLPEIYNCTIIIDFSYFVYLYFDDVVVVVVLLQQ